MEAEKKLQSVMYHFQRMEEMYLKDEQEFIYELEAFLVKARSVPDILLEDFNKKFSLDINLEEKLTPEIFENRARQLQKAQALNFIQWWKSKMEKIRSSQIGSILLKKRNISVHRRVISPNLIKIKVFDIAVATESLTIEKYNKNGKLIEKWTSPEMPPKPVEPKPAEIDWCFSECPDKNVLEVCREIIQVLKELIEEVKVQFN